MKVVVGGGRTFGDERNPSGGLTDKAINERALLKQTLDQIHRETPITLLIHGGAMGADHHAVQWAMERNVPRKEFPANWLIGRQAGPIRNRRMIREGQPDLVVVFPGGTGTAHLTNEAKLASVPVQTVLSTGEG
jgi:predicted Rossmann-fold nucleotide-binding protein